MTNFAAPLQPNSPRLTMRAAAMLGELRKRRLIGSLHDWCAHCLAPLGQKPQAHHRLLIEKLEAVERGEITRLMVMMPPGAAKSTYASVLFPPWFLARKRGRTAILASHTADLAEANSGKVIRTIGEFGPALGLGTLNEGVKYWRTNNGGEVKSAGVGGPITGRRADLALIDDPVKSAEDAESVAYRDKAWNWFQADLSTRLKAGKHGEPSARIVLIMTRWHEDDLAGRLLQTQADRWQIVKLEAQNTRDDDPLGRGIGEYLWSGDPDYDYGALLAEAKADYERNGAMRVWQALYQQDPRPGEGALFKTALIRAIPASMPGTSVRAWDLAATRELGTRDPDWTVGARMTKTADGQFVIDDVVRLRGSPDEVEATILATASRDGHAVKIKLPQDPGQAGKAQVLYLTRKLAGYRVMSAPVTGDKATRAAPFAAQVNVGNVAMVTAAWNRPLIDELAGFPSATHDDQVDAVSDAFAALIAPPEPTRSLNLNFMGR
ncbi:MAG TPA: phage terminase large subunit [Acidiphilium sp.]|nr:phage terminase large subunit [Acidiphilium sp.]